MHTHEVVFLISMPITYTYTNPYFIQESTRRQLPGMNGGGKEHEPRVFILSCQGVSSFDFKVPPGTWCYLPHERHCFYWSQLTLSCQLMNFIISFCLFYFKLVYKHKVETPGKQWQELWPILSCSLTLWHHSITFLLDEWLCPLGLFSQKGCIRWSKILGGHSCL